MHGRQRGLVREVAESEGIDGGLGRPKVFDLQGGHCPLRAIRPRVGYDGSSGVGGDAVPDFPSERVVREAVSQGPEIGYALEEELIIKRLGHTRIPARVSISDIEAEQGTHTRCPIGVGLAIGVELAGQIGIGMNVDAARHSVGSDSVQVRRVHLIAAGEKEGGGIGIGIESKARIVNDRKLVPEAFKGAPNHRVLLVGAGPAHHGGFRPKQRNVGGRPVGTGKEPLELHVFHPQEHLGNIRVSRFGQPVLLDHAKTSFADENTVEKVAVVPGEDVSANRPGHERFPHRPVHSLGLALGRPREQIVGGACAGLGHQHGQSRVDNMLGDTEINGAQFVKVAQG